MKFMERLDNIYLVDTRMFGFPKYMSSYIVAGKEIVLVDTGQPAHLEDVRSGIAAHGFSLADISRIFITHMHSDHSGNAGAFSRENPKAKIYIHPLGVAQLIDPSIEMTSRKNALPGKMPAKIGEMEPIPSDRIQQLNDGDVFDLGNGERLRVIFAPGHSPDGIVIFEEKNNGLFIDDLVGSYSPDADAHYALNPPESNPWQSIESLKKLLDLPVKYLYLSHYGIVDNPKQVIQQSIDKIQDLLDIGARFTKEGTPEKITPAVHAVVMAEMEKIRAARGEEIYQYLSKDYIFKAKEFARIYHDGLNK